MQVPNKVLLVTPHPDDAEGGCGGTVARWIEQGAEVVYVLCTNGDKGTTDLEMTPPRLAETREREQLEAARVLGVKDVVFLRHPDGTLEDDRQFREEVVREIRRHRPDVVMCMGPVPSRQPLPQGPPHQRPGDTGRRGHLRLAAPLLPEPRSRRGTDATRGPEYLPLGQRGTRHIRGRKHHHRQKDRDPPQARLSDD